MFHKLLPAFSALLLTSVVITAQSDVRRASAINGAGISSSNIYVPNGTFALPSISFINGTDFGFNLASYSATLGWIRLVHPIAPFLALRPNVSGATATGGSLHAVYSSNDATGPSNLFFAYGTSYAASDGDINTLAGQGTSGLKGAGGPLHVGTLDAQPIELYTGGTASANKRWIINSTGNLIGSTGLSITSLHVSSGATPTVANVGANSCGTTAATIAGNSNAGRVTVGATSGTQCRVTTTITAPTAWECSSSDDTTAVLSRCVGVDTTHFDLLGVYTAGDNVSYVAIPR